MSESTSDKGSIHTSDDLEDLDFDRPRLHQPDPLPERATVARKKPSSSLRVRARGGVTWSVRVNPGPAHPLRRALLFAEAGVRLFGLEAGAGAQAQDHRQKLRLEHLSYLDGPKLRKVRAGFYAFSAQDRSDGPTLSHFRPGGPAAEAVACACSIMRRVLFPFEIVVSNRRVAGVEIGIGM